MESVNKRSLEHVIMEIYYKCVFPCSGDVSLRVCWCVFLDVAVRAVWAPHLFSQHLTKAALCGHSNLRPRFPLQLQISIISWHGSPPLERKHWICLCLRVDVSSRPPAGGLDSKGQLTERLSEKSFSAADWGPLTLVSRLSRRPEIIQSTGFELEIREEGDDLRMDLQYMRTEGLYRWRGNGNRCMETEEGQVR